MAEDYVDREEMFFLGKNKDGKLSLLPEDHTIAAAHIRAHAGPERTQMYLGGNFDLRDHYIDCGRCQEWVGHLLRRKALHLASLRG